MFQTIKQRENTTRQQLQASLEVGRPGDKYEQEADAVADRVMGMTDSYQMQMQPMEEEEEVLQPKLRMQPMEEEEEMLQPKAERSLQPELNYISSSPQGDMIQMGPGDWIKRWLFNGQVINNSGSRVRVWSSDRQGESGNIEDGLYWVDANSRSASSGEDVDHVRDSNGQWYKIGARTTRVDADGRVSDFECRVNGPGEACPEQEEGTLPGGVGDMDAGVPSSSDAGEALPGGV